MFAGDNKDWLPSTVGWSDQTSGWGTYTARTTPTLAGHTNVEGSTASYSTQTVWTNTWWIEGMLSWATRPIC